MKKQPTTVIVMRNSDGRILILRKSGTPDWCLPGGRVNDDEQPLDAVIREVREETSLELKRANVRYIGENVSYTGRMVYTFSYDCPIGDMVMLSDKHSNYAFAYLQNIFMGNYNMYGNTADYVSQVLGVPRLDKHLCKRRFMDNDGITYSYRDIVLMAADDPKVLDEDDICNLRSIYIGMQVIPNSMMGYIERIL